MARTIHFNTGRKYTAHGQRITATEHDDGHVTFYDHDRMITGEIFFCGLFTQREVMAAYDGSLYDPSTRAWEDGMTRGGCNSVYAG